MIANGGLLVKPRLVLKKGDQAVPVVAPVRVVRPETAITMRQMMEGVVLHGTGTGARLQGYSVGGKTGSAQIFDNVTHHYTHTYNGTFMGFAPITNPQIVVVVTLNGTHGTAGFGGAAAAPVFKVVAEEALRVLETSERYPRRDAAAHGGRAGRERLADADTVAARNILEDGDDDAEPATVAVGPRQDRRAAPKPAEPKGAELSSASRCAPSWRRLGAKGLPSRPTGAALRACSIRPPGATLHEGERIRVQFAR